MPFVGQFFHSLNDSVGSITMVASNTENDTNTLTIPSTSRVGDFAVIGVMLTTTRSNGAPGSSLTGWTNLISSGTENFSPASSIRCEMWVRILGTGDPNRSLTGFGTDGIYNERRRKFIYVFRSTKSINSFNSVGTVSSINYNANPALQTITNQNTRFDDKVVYAGFFADSSSSSSDGDLSQVDGTLSAAFPSYAKLQYKIYNGRPAGSLTIDKGNGGQFNFQGGSAIRLNP